MEIVEQLCKIILLMRHKQTAFYYSKTLESSTSFIGLGPGINPTKLYFLYSSFSNVKLRSFNEIALLNGKKWKNYVTTNEKKYGGIGSLIINSLVS